MRSFQIPATAFLPFPVPSAPHKEGWEGWQLEPGPAAQRKPFLAALQQYVAHQLYPIPSGDTPHGWEGQQLEYRFARPFPAAQQQWSAFQPAGRILSVTPYGYWEPFDLAFVKPFPAAQQRYEAREDRLYPSPPSKWPSVGYQMDFALAGAIRKPFLDQPYATFQPRGTISSITPQGWRGSQPDYRVTVPKISVSAQRFDAWPAEIVPLFFPPGAGKRKDVPPGIPDPPYGVRPNKPFRPVWDKPPEAEPAPVAAPVGPPPLPPPEIFAAKAAPRLDGFVLPSFDHLVPPGAAQMAQRYRDAMETSDAIQALKAMGLMSDEDKD